MNDEQWVQSIYSKDAKKWRALDGGAGGPLDYTVCGEGGQLHYLPKSEYAPCEPPERWVNVTDRLPICAIRSGVQVTGSWGSINAADGYRIRQVEANIVERDGKTWVLVLEKKVQP